MTRLGQSPVAGPAAAPDPPPGSDSCGRPAAPPTLPAPAGARAAGAGDRRRRRPPQPAHGSPAGRGLRGARGGRPQLGGDRRRRGTAGSPSSCWTWGWCGPAGRFLGDWSRRRPGPHAPLVLLSTEDVAETVAAVEAAGAVGFLRLPCDLDDLLALVRRTALPAPAPARAGARPPAGGPGGPGAACPRGGQGGWGGGRGGPPPAPPAAPRPGRGGAAPGRGQGAGRAARPLAPRAGGPPRPVGAAAPRRAPARDRGPAAAPAGVPRRVRATARGRRRAALTASPGGAAGPGPSTLYARAGYRSRQWGREPSSCGA